MKDQIVAAAVQMNVVFEDVGGNLSRAERLIVRAAEAGAELVLLPEEFNTGFPHEGLHRDEMYRRKYALAESLDGPTVGWMGGPWRGGMECRSAGGSWSGRATATTTRR